jgi:hypothetical protein
MVNCQLLIIFFSNNNYQLTIDNYSFTLTGGVLTDALEK